MAPRHMGAGLTRGIDFATTEVEVPSDVAAARMALTSACAVGSHGDVTRFVPVAMRFPPSWQ